MEGDYLGEGVGIDVIEIVTCGYIGMNVGKETGDIVATQIGRASCRERV